jgi:transforming growth factor-beta-induced protein
MYNRFVYILKKNNLEEMKMKLKFPKVALLVLVLLMTVLAGTALAAPAAQEENDIVEVAVADGRFKTLAAALEAADLVETLQGPGPFTVFAPTDDAFAALPAGALDDLLADPAALKDVLLYHVLPGQVLAADVVNLSSADTALGQPLAISVDGSTVKVNEAQVTATDVQASNGVIHVIDAVLLPAAEEEAPDQEQMSTPMAVTCQEDYVVQAEDWLSKIADKFYGDVLAFPAIVEATNAAAETGGAYKAITNPDVIEVGQTLCIPKVEDITMAEDKMTGDTIVDIAVADGRFKTLAAALEAAGLVETLQGPGPFTVFAPTDDAFAALPAGALDGLLADPAALKDVLLYHVVSGQVLAADVVNLSSADTALGQPLAITVNGSTVKVNEAQVTVTDIQASNGVIHVIDTVLLPPSN